MPPRLELNGRAVTGLSLELYPAFGSYGHFTAMQVRGGRVRGLDFHLARLDAATRELFGVGLSGERVLGHLRHALGHGSSEKNDGRNGSTTRDASVRINVFSPDGSVEPPAGVEPEISVLLTVGPPHEMPAGPLSLCSVPYQRPFAHIKHVGGFAQGHYIKLVERRGFDEPLLVGEGGLIAEGAITNVGFIQGDAVVWPQAPMLLGTGMQVLQRELSAADVPQHHRRVLLDDLAAFDGAFVTNSRGIATVRRIDELDIPLGAPLLAHVLDRCAQAPWDAI